MSYQSKTYSLSDEVIAAIDAARERGLTPNKYLRALIALAAATEAGEYTTLDSVLKRNRQAQTIPPLLMGNREEFQVDLDAIGPRLSDGRGKATKETRKGGKR